jgi:hypothetical protein
VLLEGLLGLLLIGEEDEGVARGLAILEVNEEDAVLAIQHLTRVGFPLEKLQLQGRNVQNYCLEPEVVRQKHTKLLNVSLKCCRVF